MVWVKLTWSSNRRESGNPRLLSVWTCNPVSIPDRGGLALEIRDGRTP